MYFLSFGVFLTLVLTAGGQVTEGSGSGDEVSKTDLYFLGMACFNGSRVHGTYIRPATEMALEHINAREDILPEYTLKVIWTDTYCLPGPAVNSMFKELYSEPTKIMLIGTGRSPVSEATAQASHYWNLIQISPVSVSPALSNKKTFPLFFRVSSPYVSNVPAQMAMLKEFRWQKVATIHQSIELFSQAMNDLGRRLHKNGYTLISSEIFAFEAAQQIKNLQKHDVRIIIGGFNPELTPNVFCEAYKAGLYGPKIVWLIAGYLDDYWYTKYPTGDCTEEQIATAAEGAFGFDTLTYDYRDSRGISGMSANEWLEAYFAYLNNTDQPVGYRAAGMAYDMGWAAALALNNTAQVLKTSGSGKRLEDFTYQDGEIRKIIFESMHNLSFPGVKGQVEFDANGDSAALSKIIQYQGGVKKILGFFDSTKSDRIDWLEHEPIIWQGGSPPRDSVVRLTRVLFVEMSTYIGICSTASLGIVLSMVFLVFNIIYRNKRFIKMSSPVMNNVTIFGSVLAYLTVFLQETSDFGVIYFCKLRTYSLMLGFSIAFGALFAKTWRVYMIFTRTTKRTVLRDHQLVLVVVVLAGIDVVIAVARELLDPLKVVPLAIGNIELDGGDTIITEEIRLCTSSYELYFKGAVFVIKGLLLIFGAFLSWQTRKVTIPALNDSQYIGMCIYNIAVLSFLGVVLSFVLTENVELSYLFTSGFIIFGTTITQIIIFAPKILKFKFSKVDDDEMNTMGTVNGGTSAMPTMLSANVKEGSENTSKELAEAKKTIVALKEEIEKLKK